MEMWPCKRAIDKGIILMSTPQHVPLLKKNEVENAKEKVSMGGKALESFLFCQSVIMDTNSSPNTLIFQTSISRQQLSLTTRNMSENNLLYIYMITYVYI